MGELSQEANGSRDDVDHLDTTSVGGSQSDSRSHRTDESHTDASTESTRHVFSVPQLTSFDYETDVDKKDQLRAMFPDLKEFDITFALEKAKYEFQTALENLLKVQYLRSTGQEARGVDGFFREDDGPELEKGKKKGKKPAKDPMPHDNGSFTPKEDAKALKRELSMLAKANGRRRD